MLRLISLPTLSLMTAIISAQPLIVAHRGASGQAPENTLPAFRLAWEQGADAIEGDFHLTGDGQLICWHDADTGKRAGEKLTIAETPLARLQLLDAGAWKGDRWTGTPAPTLAQVIATVPEDAKFFIEIKGGAATVPPLLEVLDYGGLKGSQIVVISFSRDVVRAFKAARPGLTVNWLTSFRRDEQGRLRPTAEEIVATVGELGADGVGFKGLSHIDRDFIQTLREAGLGAHVWTINSPAEARRFQDLGVDSITTDYPALIRQAL